ncbi:hypothetical protein CTI12_AA268920 [Artemisia annua]|uniref:Homologous recombination OB-fold protein OB-fold domain-containing protein n=1 Tax=Artemisia annua TaxID=35608 RepID=A0A2U1M2W9_ARTAN|nr:hypothetical protein CTI12_AA268920 [Artemisia annua]
MNSPSNDDWVELLDIDDSDLQLTASLPPLNTQVHGDISTTQNVDVANLEEIKHVRIIPGPAGIIQAAKLRKQSDIHEGGVESVLSTQEYIKKIVEDVGVDEDFNRGPWLSAIEYVTNNGGIVSGCSGDIKKNLNNKGKLEQVIAIVKSCTPNVLGDLTVTLKDLSGTIGGTIHHKIFDEGGPSYGKVITVGAVLIIANVSVFSPKSSSHYLNITMRNVLKVFHKDTFVGNGSGNPNEMIENLT